MEFHERQTQRVHLLLEPITIYQKLTVWQKTHRTILAVYQNTANFPREEIYGITSQLRRAAVSINLNIVEGNARGTIKDYVRFLHHARASSQETHYIVTLSKELNYLSPETADQLLSQIEEITKMLNGLISVLQKKIKQ